MPFTFRNISLAFWLRLISDLVPQRGLNISIKLEMLRWAILYQAPGATMTLSGKNCAILTYSIHTVINTVHIVQTPLLALSNISIKLTGASLNQLKFLPQDPVFLTSTGYMVYQS